MRTNSNILELGEARGFSWIHGLIGWLAGWLVGWLLALAAVLEEDDDEEGFQGCLTHSSLEELSGLCRWQTPFI